MGRICEVLSPADALKRKEKTWMIRAVRICGILFFMTQNLLSIGSDPPWAKVIVAPIRTRSGIWSNRSDRSLQRSPSATTLPKMSGRWCCTVGNIHRAGPSGGITAANCCSTPRLTLPRSRLCETADIISSAKFVEQIHSGMREVLFDGVPFRTGRAAMHDPSDLQKLIQALTEIDPESWTLDSVESADDPAEELAFARQCFVDLRTMFASAHKQRQVIVCEEF